MIKNKQIVLLAYLREIERLHEIPTSAGMSPANWIVDGRTTPEIAAGSCGAA